MSVLSMSVRRYIEPSVESTHLKTLQAFNVEQNKIISEQQNKHFSQG